MTVKNEARMASEQDAKTEVEQMSAGDSYTSDDDLAEVYGEILIGKKTKPRRGTAGRRLKVILSDAYGDICAALEKSSRATI
jgi:hypothetical protein